MGNRELFVILSLLLLLRGQECTGAKVVFVSSKGTNTETACGSSAETACGTLFDGYEEKNNASAVKLVIGEGTFDEIMKIDVVGSLEIVGKGAGSIVSKGETSPVLFNLTDASALTVANIQIELVPYTSSDFPIDHFVNVETNASVVFRSCRITTSDDEVIGQSIFVNNAEASLGLYGCTIYHVITSDYYSYSMIYAKNINMLTIVGSSFVEIIGGPCFQVGGANGVVVMDSLFLQAEGGGGYMTGLRQSITVSSCGFWNITNFGEKDFICGGLFIHTVAGDPIYTGLPNSGPLVVPKSWDTDGNWIPVNVTITGSTFVHCHSTYTGGGVDVGGYVEFYVEGSLKDGVGLQGGEDNLKGGDTIFTLTGCSFLQCSANNGGGVFADSYSTANINDCTFIQCKARDFGGAVYYGALETYFFSLDLTLNEMYVVNCVFLDNELADVNRMEGDDKIYHVKGKGSDIAVSLFEPVLGYIPLNVTQVYSGKVTITHGGTVEDPIQTHTQEPRSETITVFHYEGQEDVYIESDNVDGLTCSATGGCEIPCASYGNVCVRPYNCTNGFNAINGVCTPPCLYNNEYISGCKSEAKVESCALDYNLGCWVCILDSEPTDACGSIGSHQGDVTSNGRRCALESCKSIDHYLVDPLTNRCVLKACSERRKNDDITNLPCGPECYWDAGELCGANDKCIDYGTRCTNNTLASYTNKDNLTHSCVPDVVERDPGQESRKFDPLWLWLIIPLSLILAAGCCGLCIFLLWKRRKDEEEEENPFEDAVAGSGANAPQDVSGPLDDGGKSPHSGSSKHSHEDSRSSARSRRSRHSDSRSGSRSGSPSGSRSGSPSGSHSGSPSGSRSGSPSGSRSGSPSGSRTPRRSSQTGKGSLGGDSDTEESLRHQNMRFQQDNSADAPVVNIDDRNTGGYDDDFVQNDSDYNDDNRFTPPVAPVMGIDSTSEVYPQYDYDDDRSRGNSVGNGSDHGSDHGSTHGDNADASESGDPYD